MNLASFSVDLICYGKHRKRLVFFQKGRFFHRDVRFIQLRELYSHLYIMKYDFSKSKNRKIISKEKINEEICFCDACKKYNSK